MNPIFFPIFMPMSGGGDIGKSALPLYLALNFSFLLYYSVRSVYWKVLGQSHPHKSPVEHFFNFVFWDGNMGVTDIVTMGFLINNGLAFLYVLTTLITTILSAL